MNNQQKNVHYFPGHMKKALTSLSSFMKLIDLVVEVADARAPISTRNPLLNEIAPNKPRLLFLSKEDKADPAITKMWIDYFTKASLPCMSGNLKVEKLTSFSKRLEPLLKPKREKEAKLGMKPQPLRLVIVGIPNVGKSTLINNLAGRSLAKAANKPGVTRAEQWIKLGNDLLLLDTPGILPMNYPDGATAVRLALLGSIKEEVLPNDELALALLGYLKENYPSCLSSRYGIGDLRNCSDNEVFSAIATKRGFLLPGGKADVSKAALCLAKDFQDGLLGRLSLERVPDAR
ncbi:MAG: ribosome biogenesis GTPase YlqF [Bacilli bacterium]|jgi:ribosome biogenesis GTPase A|nr:ribosome biogenesis GTPase YlqF [Bacilli bacterium]MCH4210465.1 ribosome biogenesis GTPase YlqF [Bacilli bacterium]MCH4228360.1 ribosome biogenesis GTPase YlqF [Bacilli bacterium]MCH4277638.1 ribosome biogenesis GTPase YlqF [Bacilli bacterium]MCI2054824.1 ribosome biogenesis GTPase YlqF [Bacilli bacterium]